MTKQNRTLQISHKKSYLSLAERFYLLHTLLILQYPTIICSLQNSLAEKKFKSEEAVRKYLISFFDKSTVLW